MKDTYSRREGNVISLGTDKLAMELTLTPEGRFVQTSLCHRVTGKEYVQCGPVQPDEFSIEVNGERICGNRGGFTLTGVETRTLSQGEEETIVSLRRAGLAIRRHYIAYPGLAIVQSFTEYVNESGADMTVSKPSLFVVRLLGGEQAKVRLCKLVNKETNVLLLDEPTNHLDVDAKEALKEALKEYRGSVLLICHEPEFYQDVVSQVWDCSKWTTKIL